MPVAKGKVSKGKKPVAVKRTKKRTETFAIYIYRVLKQVQPETGISKKSMSILNSFINDVFENLQPTTKSKTVKNLNISIKLCHAVWLFKMQLPLAPQKELLD